MTISNNLKMLANSLLLRIVSDENESD